MQNDFLKDFDAVVMLTWSDWRTELRSNRYHYATRFARSHPVLFVQPDLNEAQYKLEDSGIVNLTILHIWKNYDNIQIDLLNQVLSKLKYKNILFWVYNVYFIDFLEGNSKDFVVLHATEDYIISWPNKCQQLYYSLLRLLNRIDLLVTVSEGVEEGYTSVAKYQGERIMIGNGCDYKFYSDFVPPVSDPNIKIIFYEGNISSDKLNISLLKKLSVYYSGYEFWFCGKIVGEESHCLELFQQSNIKYLGVLSPKEVRSLAHQATLGIIPFNETDILIERSLPLKAFEYVACGLPVVTVPIKALLSYKDIFNFASTFEEFVMAINAATLTRHDSRFLKIRSEEAAKQDYDLKFEQVCCLIASIKLNTNRGSKSEKLFKLKALTQFHKFKNIFGFAIGISISKMKNFISIKKGVS